MGIGNERELHSVVADSSYFDKVEVQGKVAGEGSKRVGVGIGCVGDQHIGIEVVGLRKIGYNRRRT